MTCGSAIDQENKKFMIKNGQCDSTTTHWGWWSFQLPSSENEAEFYAKRR